MLSSANDPTNIGNPQELTIEDIARTILRLTGSSSRIVYKALPVDDPKVRKPDITRATAILNWTPKVALDAGLGETIAYFREKLEAR
jgi:dTDP-glucose 4,6-dehydratase